MNDPLLTGYVFSPAARTLDFSGVPGFALPRLFTAEHKPSGKLLYLAGMPDLAPGISADRLVLTINAGVDLAGMQAGDPISFRYDPVPAVTQPVSAAALPLPTGAATAAKQDEATAAVRGSTVTADTSGTLAAGGSATPVAANLARQFIEISNTGANPLAYRWGAAASAAVGHVLGAGQSVRYDAKVPTAALNLFSTSGTTFFVTTG